jgi:FAD:protein FMN transferase
MSPWVPPASAAPPPELIHCFHALGGPCRITLEDPPTAGALQAAEAEVRRIEAKYSRYRADSVLSRLNACAGSGQAQQVDSETAELLDFAASAHAASGGLFDITTGVLRKAWDFSQPRLPEPAALQALLALVGWPQVQWARPWLLLPRAGMELDLGGIGKEYAADRAAAVLAQAGVEAGLVNLGGDIRALGPRRDGQAWRLGVAHPRQAGAVVAELELASGALATSGDYERYFELDGRRYCHLLDPRTGWPVAHWQSVSVVAPACVAAGAVASIAMLMGAQALDFLDREATAWLAIAADGQVHRRAAGLPSA